MPRVDPRGDTLPLFIPESDWRPPTEPPNLSGVRRLGYDTETKDPLLTSFGSGFMHKKASVIGFSLATDDRAWYFPIGHAGDNCTWDVVSFIRDTCKDAGREYIGANMPYDVESSASLGIEIAGRWIDVQVAEPLLDEEKVGGYSLDALAKYYLDDAKDETLLKDAAQHYHIDPKAEMYKLPARFAGAYAEHDASLPLRVYDKQKILLAEQGLVELFDMETELLRVVWLMRQHGVRVDLDKAERLRKEWAAESLKLSASLKESLGGMEVDIWSPKQLVQMCSRLNIVHPLTDAGNPSFGNDWLDNHPHPALNIIAKARKYDKMRRDFLDGGIFKYQIAGRVHAQFHTLRGDDDGTRSGRFSSSQPNMQQIPARDPYFGPEIRSLYLPDEGEEWFSGDFKAQEPRLLVHFASLLEEVTGASIGAREMVAAYHADPKLDLHLWTAKLCGTDKPKAKTINLGLTYGMGLPKLAMQLGLSIGDTEDLLAVYLEKMPFVKPTANMAKAVAERRGYVKTILGRRSRFKLVGDQRQYTHKALNRIIQGSGADMIKKAILLVWKELNKIPLLTVHDENNYSIRERALAALITQLMQDALPLRVPNIVEVGIGKNWSEAH